MVFLFLSGNGGEADGELFRSRDGSALPASSPAPLGGRVRRGVEDFVQVKGGAAGLTVTVTDKAHRVLWRRTVPGSKGIGDGYAYAAPVTRHSCADVLVMGAGRTATVSAVLASNGQVRWAVTRAGSGLGTVVHPAAPRVSC